MSRRRRARKERRQTLLYVIFGPGAQEHLRHLWVGDVTYSLLQIRDWRRKYLILYVDLKIRLT